VKTAARSSSRRAHREPGEIYDGHLTPVEADAITHLDFWPYPPVDQQLRQIFDHCMGDLGPPSGIFANIFSPLHLEFVDSHGGHFGIPASRSRAATSTRSRSPISIGGRGCA
jgi:hypothetical protein